MAGRARLEEWGRPPSRVARDSAAIECPSQLYLADFPCLLRFETPRPNRAPLLSVRGARAHTSSNLLTLAQDLGKARLLRRRELRSVRTRGARRTAPLPARDEEQAEGADEQDGGGAEPQQRGMCGEAWLEQHELAVARHQEIDHLAVAVARLQALAHENAQVAGKRRVGIVDRLILTDHAAQLLGERARARFQRRVGEHLVGLHRQRGRRREREHDKEHWRTEPAHVATPLAPARPCLAPAWARPRAAAGRRATARRRPPSPPRRARSAAPAAYSRAAPRASHRGSDRRARDRAGRIRASSARFRSQRCRARESCAWPAPSRR